MHKFDLIADQFMPLISQGWSGPKEFHGEFIEGSFRSHQVPLPNAKTDEEELQALQHWLSSYKPHELFHIKSNHKEDGHPIDDVLSIIPFEQKKLGLRKEAYAAFEALQVPGWIDRGVEKGSQVSCMKVVGSFLKEVIKEYVDILARFSYLQITIFFYYYCVGIQRRSASSRLMNWRQTSLTLCSMTVPVTSNGI